MLGLVNGSNGLFSLNNETLLEKVSVAWSPQFEVITINDKTMTKTPQRDKPSFKLTNLRRKAM